MVHAYVHKTLQFRENKQSIQRWFFYSLLLSSCTSTCSAIIYCRECSHTTVYYIAQVHTQVDTRTVSLHSGQADILISTHRQCLLHTKMQVLLRNTELNAMPDMWPGLAINRLFYKFRSKSYSCFVVMTATVEHTKRVEKSSLDTLLIFSELKGLVHICMYHHEGLSFRSWLHHMASRHMAVTWCNMAVKTPTQQTTLGEGSPDWLVVKSD